MRDEAIAPYRVRTTNISTESTNRIHDDAVAASYGFRGGLVAGTLVYAHTTTPLVASLGEAWLDGSTVDLKLLQPAYDGEMLTVCTEGPDDGAWQVAVENEEGTTLARLVTRLDAAQRPVDAHARVAPAPPGGEPVPVSWDAVVVGAGLRALRWSPDAADNAAWCEAAGDTLDLYRGARARVHPGRVLQGANELVKSHFALGPWIHVASRIVHRGAVRVGDEFELRGVTTRRWERKGHQIATAYVVFLRDGEPATEIWHDYIFRVRPAP